MNQSNNRALSYRFYDVILALITWLAIIIQVIINDNIANLFSYFTILTNLSIAASLSYSLIRPDTKAGRFFSTSSFQSALASYIIIVSLIYNFVIRSSWHQPFLEFTSDNILHILTPILYVLRWGLFTPKGTLKWNDSLKWLIVPFAYLFYSLIRGSIVNWYPYAFIDLRHISIVVALQNIVMTAFAFWVIGLLLIAANHWLKREKIE